MVLEKRSVHSDRIIKDLMLQGDKALRETEALHAKKGESTTTAEGQQTSQSYPTQRLEKVYMEAYTRAFFSTLI
jgi:hypothetical protein